MLSLWSFNPWSLIKVCMCYTIYHIDWKICPCVTQYKAPYSRSDPFLHCTSRFCIAIKQLKKANYIIYCSAFRQHECPKNSSNFRIRCQFFDIVCPARAVEASLGICLGLRYNLLSISKKVTSVSCYENSFKDALYANISDYCHASHRELLDSGRWYADIGMCPNGNSKPPFVVI